MGKSNVLDFKKLSNKKLQEQFELEGCDEELLDLVSKLVSCSPGSIDSKKKDLSKAEFLNWIREQRRVTPAAAELTDDELDSAAGGVRLPENSEKPKLNPPNHDPFHTDK